MYKNEKMLEGEGRRSECFGELERGKISLGHIQYSEVINRLFIVM